MVDAASGYVWGQPQKETGTAKSTVKLLRQVCTKFATPRIWQTDGGSHFKGEVKEACEELGITHLVTPAYAAWVNGLVEGTNKLLISRLKRKCAPDLDESEYEGEVDPQSIAANWPYFFDEVIAELNDRIKPGTRFTPREILFGLLFAPIHTAPETEPVEPTAKDVEDRIALAEIMRDQSFTRHTADAERRRKHSDKATHPIQFQVGDLVQIYDTHWDFSVSSDRKLAPRWSAPRIIVSQGTNSYRIARMDGTLIDRNIHANHVRGFVVRPETPLDLAITRATTAEALQSSEGPYD
jgi:hypothetical protein